MQDIVEKPLRILVITSKYKHHSENAGYIQLSKFIKPAYIIGIDETQARKPPYILIAYKWLYEFIGWWKYRNKIDLVHIYYGEEYYRFSGFLFRKIPVIVTFHQPKEKLIYEIRHGGDGGRIYRLAHRLTRNRFKKIAAAIVLEESQREVLKEVMLENKIHVIYHGVYLMPQNPTAKTTVSKNNKLILSLGNWLRDWDFFENILSEAYKQLPDVTFKLINKSIDPIVLNKLNKLDNFKYEADVSDDELINFIREAKFLFLPLKSGAGNNAVMESLALGTPLLLPDIFHKEFQLKCDAIFFYKPDDINDCILQIRHLLIINSEENKLITNKALELIEKFSWEEIAKKTFGIYENCV